MHFIISCLNVYFKITPIYIPEKSPCYRAQIDPGFAHIVCKLGKYYWVFEAAFIFPVLLKKKKGGKCGESCASAPLGDKEILETRLGSQCRSRSIKAQYLNCLCLDFNSWLTSLITSLTPSCQLQLLQLLKFLSCVEIVKPCFPPTTTGALATSLDV